MLTKVNAPTWCGSVMVDEKRRPAVAVAILCNATMEEGSSIAPGIPWFASSPTNTLDTLARTPFVDFDART